MLTDIGFLDFDHYIRKVKTSCRMVDKDQVRNNIIRAAGTIFSKFGFRKTTMDEIARAAGKGKSSIYYYFSSKEEIFEAVVVKEARTLKKELSKVIAGSPDPLEKLRNYILVRMKTFHQLSNFYRAIFDEGLSHFDFIERIRERYDKQEILTIRSIFLEGIKTGHFKPEDPDLVAIAIVRALKGLEIPLFWTHVNEDVDIATEEILNILFYGIVKQ